MTKATERTKLLNEHVRPQYVFDSSITRERKRRIKQFQCCLCAIFICVVAMALVVVVSFSISKATDPAENNTLLPLETLTILLANPFPLSDKNLSEKLCVNQTKWERAIEIGQKALQEKDEIEKQTPSIPVNTPSYRHQKVVATSRKGRELARIGYVEGVACKFLHNKKVVSRLCLAKNSTLKQPDYCLNKPQICNYTYRSYNGSCNNLKYAQFGVAYQPFRRSLPPDYADGISQPRVSKDGTALPSARTVSLIVHRPYYKDDTKFSVILAVWGQFLDHDITATALSQGFNGSSISCCNNNGTIHPECFPVNLDPLDPFLEYNITCMEFVRSAPAPTCCLGPREQLNQVTSFIDGSVVYGVEEDKVRQIRSFTGGLLDMYLTEDNRTLLPVSKDISDGCNRKQQNDEGKYCFLTGDARANENLHLTSMHLIWARQHNLLAKSLLHINPRWTDEKLFQEARKILGAQLQHITYNEFLPILLGFELMEKFDLNPKSSGYFNKYDANVNPGIANNFATASFRFAHTIIPGLMKLLANDSSSPEFVQTHKMLFDPYKLYQPGELDRALRGAMETNIEASDPYFTNELKEHLFEQTSEKRKSCGLDLVSLNIQRGRDHGLVGYNSWREHCGLRRSRMFQQLNEDIDGDSLLNIKSIYRNVDDIDLYTGALSEKPLNNSILGPTLTCLILDQFVRLKLGDRFWYENLKVFSSKQLEEIRKTTLARIICDNSDNVKFTQKRVMERVREGNELVRCDELPEVNLKFWEEMGRVSLENGEVSAQVVNF